MRFSDIKQNPWDYDRKTVLDTLNRYFTTTMPTDAFPITKKSYPIFLTVETTEPIPVTLETKDNISYINSKTLEQLYDNHLEGKPSFTEAFLQRLICQTTDQDAFLATVEKELAVNYLKTLTKASSTVLETYFGPYFEDLLKDTNLSSELHFKYNFKSTHTITISSTPQNYLMQDTETKQWFLYKPFSEKDEKAFKKDCHTILTYLEKQPKILTHTLKLKQPLSETLRPYLEIVETLPTTLYSSNNGRRWIYDNGDYDFESDDYIDDNRYDIDVPIHIEQLTNDTLTIVFPIQKGQSLLPATQLINNKQLFRQIKKQLKLTLVNNVLGLAMTSRKNTIATVLNQLKSPLVFKENGNSYRLEKGFDDTCYYFYNDDCVITFEKENDAYTYEATSALLDNDENILKDLIHDLISKF
jgi:hypothetical protein